MFLDEALQYVSSHRDSDLLAVDVLWWTLPDNYSAFLARLGGRALDAPGIHCHHDNGRSCSDATGWPAAVGAAPQAVPIRAALVASASAVLVVGQALLLPIPQIIFLLLFLLLREQMSMAGTGGSDLTGSLETSTQLQLPHVAHHRCGIKCLLPFTFGKVLLDLGTDRFVDIFVQSRVSTDPWMLEGLLTRVSLQRVFLHQVTDEVFG